MTDFLGKLPAEWGIFGLALVSLIGLARVPRTKANRGPMSVAMFVTVAVVFALLYRLIQLHEPNARADARREAPPVRLEETKTVEPAPSVESIEKGPNVADRVTKTTVRRISDERDERASSGHSDVSGRRAASGNGNAPGNGAASGDGNATGARAASGNGNATGDGAASGNGNATGARAASGNGNATGDAAASGNGNVTGVTGASLGGNGRGMVPHHHTAHRTTDELGAR
jgi:hypothetical protein